MKMMDMDMMMMQTGMPMLHPGGNQMTKYMMSKMMKMKPGMRVLDLGCGMGMTACMMAKKYKCHVMGIDMNNEMVMMARKNAMNMKVSKMVTFKKMNAMTMSVMKEKFDMIISESSMAFMDSKKMMKKVMMMLRPGGMFMMHEPMWKTKPSKDMSKMVSMMSTMKLDTMTEMKKMMMDMGYMKVMMMDKTPLMKKEMMSVKLDMGVMVMMKMMSMMTMKPSKDMHMSYVMMSGMKPMK